jgi:acetyl-CoA C-acetyltransferase
VVAVEAGLPVHVPQFTLSKACGGGMRAVTLAAQVIKSGDAHLLVAGGMESMSNAAYLLKKARWGYRLGHGELQDQLVLFDPLSGMTMGETAENVAKTYHVSRAEQDAFALESHRRAERAIRAGRFGEQIVPVEIPQKDGRPVLFDTDEHPRFGITMEDLAALEPAFRKNGTVTAGNSCGMNDAACALLLMSEEKARALEITPIASIIAYASVGVDPALMGMGPVPATRLALERAGLSLDRIDLIELGEAFAAQALACIRELGMDPAKVNVNGGAIALGHPISASGAILITKLVHEMRARQARYGLATLCIGGGQGMAVVLKKGGR